MAILCAMMLMKVKNRGGKQKKVCGMAIKSEKSYTFAPCYVHCTRMYR